MDPLPSINKVFSLIIQEEKQREICVNPISHDTSSAMMTKSFLPKHSPSTHHESTVYMSKPSPKPKFFKQPYKKDHPMCSHCGVSGHTVEKCYRVHGFPPGFKFTQIDQYHIQQTKCRSKEMTLVVLILKELTSVVLIIKELTLVVLNLMPHN
jgi:hypothetical protein